MAMTGRDLEGAGTVSDRPFRLRARRPGEAVRVGSVGGFEGLSWFLEEGIDGLVELGAFVGFDGHKLDGFDFEFEFDKEAFTTAECNPSIFLGIEANLLQGKGIDSGESGDELPEVSVTEEEE